MSDGVTRMRFFWAVFFGLAMGFSPAGAKVAAPDPALVACQIDRLVEKGTALYGASDFQQAALSFERALELDRRTYPEPDLTHAQILHNLATVYFYLGRNADAERLFLEALGIRESNLGPGDPEVAKTLSNLAVLYLFRARYREAEPLFLRAEHIREHRLGAAHPETARVIHDLGELYRKTGDFPLALKYHEKALSLRLDSRDVSPQDLGASYYNLGEVFRDMGSCQQALGFFRKAVLVFEQGLAPGHGYTKLARGRLFEMSGGSEGEACPCR